MNVALSRDQQTIAAQRIRIEELEEEVRQLREQTAPTLAFPVEWKLSLQQQRILLILYWHKGPLHWERILQRSTLRPGDAWRDEIVRVYICRLRQKCAIFGIQINTHRGIGYELDAPSRAIITNVLHPSSSQVAA